MIYRKAYTRIYDIRQRAPDVPAICLTATATPCDIHTIKASLNSPLLEMVLIPGSLYRPNLYIDVKFKDMLPCSVEVRFFGTGRRWL